MARTRANIDTTRLEAVDRNNPFILRTANQRMEFAKTQPPLRKLMGDFIYENCVTMLYSETGVGKTLLAFQLANAISKGEGILNLENECEPQIVLYADIENGEKVFESRYSVKQNVNGKDVYKDHFKWDDNLKILDLAEADQYQIEGNAVEWWLHKIETLAKQNEAKVIFIDNILSIGTMGGGIETTREIAPLIQGLIKLKKSGGYTIVAIHHTPKRNRKDPLTRNDLAGSSNLSNLVDCCIGIGKSTYKGDESSRYIKQVKPPRQGKIVYGDSNVITCRIEHIRPNFVGFKRIELNEENAEYKYESNHIKAYSVGSKNVTQDDVKENEKRIRELREANPDASQEEIGKYVGLSRQRVNHYEKKIKEKDRHKQEQMFNNYGQ